MRKLNGTSDWRGKEENRDRLIRGRFGGEGGGKNGVREERSQKDGPSSAILWGGRLAGGKWEKFHQHSSTTPVETGREGVGGQSDTG